MSQQEPSDALSVALGDAQAVVDRARRTAAWVRGMGIITVLIGLLAMILAVVGVVSGADRLENALELLVVVGLASVASGVALVGTSWSQRMSAARLELEILKHQRPL